MESPPLHDHQAAQQEGGQQYPGVQRSVHRRRHPQDDIVPLPGVDQAAIGHEVRQAGRSALTPAHVVVDERSGAKSHARIRGGQTQCAARDGGRRARIPAQRSDAVPYERSIDGGIEREVREDDERSQRDEIRQVADRLEREQVGGEEPPAPSTALEETVSELEYQRYRIVETEVPVGLIQPDTRRDDRDRQEARRGYVEEAAG